MSSPYRNEPEAVAAAWRGLEEGTALVVKQLAAENAKLRAALEFYADEKNYRLNAPLDPNSSFFDGPTRARAALAGI